MKKHKLFKKAFAWLTILVIAALIIFFLYCSFTGKNFFGSLYLFIIVPVIIWFVMFLAGCFKNKDENDDTKQ